MMRHGGSAGLELQPAWAVSAAAMDLPAGFELLSLSLSLDNEKTERCLLS